MAGLTPADRKWMDDIIQDVNEAWSGGEASPNKGLQCVAFFFSIVLADV